MPPENNYSNLLIDEIAATIYQSSLPGYQALNTQIREKFNSLENHRNTRKSHFFEGRYENIYIQKKLITEVDNILLYCESCVRKITQKNIGQSGLWFNKMLPGQTTLAHSHDDYDELYSAVYYVTVPTDSGDLIINTTSKEIVITPNEGQLILFPPDLIHHVTKNNSAHIRLSLGINIGSDQALHSEIE